MTVRLNPLTCATILLALMLSAPGYAAEGSPTDWPQGGKPRATEIKPAAPPTTITVHALVSFPEIKFGQPPWWDHYYVARRIAADRIEVWCPTDGWLFDGRGKLLNHARVPRRDGYGRQWFGAFLPDGRWATTDLWVFDHQFHIFSAGGKFVKSIPNAEIVKPTGWPFGPRELVGHGGTDWARSDANGKGWVVKIGGMGTEYFHVASDGSAEMLDLAGVNRAVYPRGLGAQAGSAVLSDDGVCELTREQAGHGPNVDHPDYRLSVPQAGFETSILNGTGNMGFWPRSHEVYIGCGREDWFKAHETRFFDVRGNLVAWVEACRFADAADGQAMLFEAADGAVLTIGPDHRVRKAVQYVWPGGKRAPVEKMYDDLKLGLFMKDGVLCLGRQ